MASETNHLSAHTCYASHSLGNLFYSQLKTYLLHKSYHRISLLPPRRPFLTVAWTVPSELLVPFFILVLYAQLAGHLVSF